MNDQILQWATELQNLAQAGLFYGHDIFDKERYSRIREIAAEMLSNRFDLPLETVQNLYCQDVGFQTPKVDTRAAIFRDGKILLVRERDGLWAVPGGWCEYNLSPVDNTIKEAREEAGLNVKVVRLIAVQDRIKHNSPSYLYGVVKIWYLCEALDGEFKANAETIESGYFGLDELPELADAKCSRNQVEMCFEAYRDTNWMARFD